MGRFQLLHRLGAGGMGVIYAAHDPELERPVAVKFVSVAGADRSLALAEAKALARLAHPNVVTIFRLWFPRGPPLHRHGVGAGAHPQSLGQGTHPARDREGLSSGR